MQVMLSVLVVVAVGAASADHGTVSVRESELRELAATLTSPAFKGRYTGTTAYSNCAKWVASKFREWGVEPAVKGQYLQPFPAPHTIVKEMALDLYLPDASAGSDRVVALRPGADFLPLLFTDSGDKTAPVAFVGWGVDAPELGYSDYADIDVTNRFVLCIRGLPDYADQRFWRHDYHIARMATARRRGAAGLVYLSDSVAANPNGQLIPGFLSAAISTPAANELLRLAGEDCAGLREKLEQSGRPNSFLIDAQMHLHVAADYYADGRGYNVIGLIRGSESELENECVVVCAHLDACGTHGGLTFWGALDNASGSAVVMSTAHELAQMTTRPRRSILFVLFGGEEMGLLGSRHFVDHLPPPFRKVTCMINIDTVGWGAATDVLFHSEFPWLGATAKAADEGKDVLRHFWPSNQVTPRSSDFGPFLAKRIPYINFFATDHYAHYHQTGDKAENIDFPHLLKLTDVISTVVRQLANID